MSTERQYIARISWGKDSLKMLEVIHSRGLPLDRITTTDVWATDTISANLPPMEEFKERMQQRIWDMYHIEVERLCARNKDGSKRTYEQMFYHIPNRRSQSIQVEREREPVPEGINPRIPRSLEPVVSGWPQTEYRSPSCKGPSKGFQEWSGSNGARSSSMCGSRIQGYPAQISPWCRKLKIDYVRTPFYQARPDGPEKISWNTWGSQRTSRIASVSSTIKSVLRWWSLVLTRTYAACIASTTICSPPPTKHRAGMAAGSAIIRAFRSSGTFGRITQTFGRYCSNGIWTALLPSKPMVIPSTTLIAVFKWRMMGWYPLTTPSVGSL